MNDGYKRVLIIGTVPYNEHSPSRALDSYFRGWDRDKLCQIFSNSRQPMKGHCGKLFQLTDRMILDKWLLKKGDAGIVYKYEDLPDKTINADTRKSKIYYSEKGPITKLLRRILWRKKFWCNKKLELFVDEFKPEVIYLCFSDDYFLLNMSLYFANKYNVPIISSIGDDYYFNSRLSINPFYYLYKKTYKKLVDKVLHYKGGCIYISDKIRAKYDEYFGKKGITSYLASNIKRRDFKEINVQNPTINYFGNINIGRNESLVEIAKALNSINENYVIHVYSGEKNNKTIAPLVKQPNIIYHGSVSYSEVVNKTMESDLLLIVEGFKKKDVNMSRYSLSTKVADSISSGVSTFAYGSSECGAIEYASQIGCCQVCTNYQDLGRKLLEIINNVDIQKQYYEVSKVIVEENHNLYKNLLKFKNYVNEVVDGAGK